MERNEPTHKAPPLPELREVLEHQQCRWDRRSFAPFGAWDEITTLRRSVSELQDRMATLIRRINNCKDC